MYMTTDAELKERIGLTVTATNYDVYTQKKGDQYFTDEPHCVFFYYWAWLPNGLPDIRHYLFDNGETPIDYGNIAYIGRYLALNARDHDYAPPKHGVNFEDIVWRRKSYFMILMDSQTWAFQKRANGGTALFFVPSPLEGIEANHSFFDGDDLDIDVSPGGDGSEMVTAFCCINHMKRNEQWEDLDYDANGKKEEQKYKFSLNFDIDGHPGRPMTFDPGGTNMGPPVPPPVLFNALGVRSAKLELLTAVEVPAT